MKFKDLTNIKFGRLIAKKIVGRNKYGNYLWECVCNCGNKKVVSSNHLNSGTKSCGCLRVEKTIERSFKHGHCKRGNKSKTNLAWYNMKRRCYYTKNINYASYGGRGITVCGEWLGKEGFKNFLTTLGESLEGMSLDRKEVNGNYEPENCRWADRRIQSHNIRKEFGLKFLSYNKENGFLPCVS